MTAPVHDLSRVELLTYAAMVIGLVWMGMSPQSFLSLSSPVIEALLQGVSEASELLRQTAMSGRNGG